MTERLAGDSARPGDCSGAKARRDAFPPLEAGLLAELRAALAEYEIRSELRREVACLAVETREPGSYLWVFLGFGGRYFSWNNADLQHPVSDMPGTARRLAALIHDTSDSGALGAGDE